MIGLLGWADTILGVAILLGVTGIVPGWELDLSGLIGSSHSFDGGVFIFVLGLFLLISGIFLALVAGRHVKV